MKKYIDKICKALTSFLWSVIGYTQHYTFTAWHSISPISCQISRNHTFWVFWYPLHEFQNCTNEFEIVNKIGIFGNYTWISTKPSKTGPRHSLSHRGSKLWGHWTIKIFEVPNLAHPLLQPQLIDFTFHEDDNYYTNHRNHQHNQRQNNIFGYTS